AGNLGMAGHEPAFCSNFCGSCIYIPLSRIMEKSCCWLDTVIVVMTKRYKDEHVEPESRRAIRSQMSSTNVLHCSFLVVNSFCPPPFVKLSFNLVIVRLLHYCSRSFGIRCFVQRLLYRRLHLLNASPCNVLQAKASFEIAD
ncbi:hypothetical protein JI435_405530, partial [Parastagonospora nodorum SN15]